MGSQSTYATAVFIGLIPYTIIVSYFKKQSSFYTVHVNDAENKPEDILKALGL